MRAIRFCAYIVWKKAHSRASIRVAACSFSGSLQGPFKIQGGLS
jgi:hypothetical protein